MKKILAALTAVALLGTAIGGAMAQPGNYGNNGRGTGQMDSRYDGRNDARNDRRDDRRDDRREARSDYRYHADWRKGRRLARNDWNRAQRVDYRAHRLPAPRRGYEWRRVDGNYVMAAVATGLIFSILAANNR